MRKFQVTIKGVTPYMQHRMDDEKLELWEKKRASIIENEHADDERTKRALFHSYINQKGEFFIPPDHFKQCMIKGGSFVKGKVGSTTKSMKNIVAGMWQIEENEIPFRPFDEVDSRSAVNKNVKARVMVHRPKWNTWDAKFTLIIDDEERSKITKDTISDIIKKGGRYLGVGSYRPEHTGEYGRFELVELKELK